METLNFIAFTGSIRKGSYNRKLIQAAQELAPDNVNIEILNIADLPHFNEDLEENFPEEAQNLKNKIEQTDGILVSTPEYNRSIPGVFKNAIDWTSRPYGQNSWVGKPVYVMGASIGGIATAIAQSHLKHSLLYLDAYVMGQPEFYLGNAMDKFDDNGKLTDADTRKLLEKALKDFVDFVQRVKK
jgi:chromate reductase